MILYQTVRAQRRNCTWTKKNEKKKKMKNYDKSVFIRSVFMWIDSCNFNIVFNYIFEIYVQTFRCIWHMKHSESANNFLLSFHIISYDILNFLVCTSLHISNMQVSKWSDEMKELFILIFLFIIIIGCIKLWVIIKKKKKVTWINPIRNNLEIKDFRSISKRLKCEHSYFASSFFFYLRVCSNFYVLDS